MSHTDTTTSPAVPPSAGAPYWKTKNFALMVVGVALYAGAFFFAPGALLWALIMVCIFSSAVFAANHGWIRTTVSLMGIVLVLVAAPTLFRISPQNFELWYPMKIVFVVYFGVFAGHLIESSLTHHNKTRIGVAMTLLIAGVGLMKALKWGAVDGTFYYWPDLIEDVAFCVVGVLATELHKG